MALSSIEFLELVEVLIKKWSELTIKELRDDINSFDSKDTFEQVALRAFWHKFSDELFLHSKKPITFEEKQVLLYEIFGDQLNLPSNDLKPDIKVRLEKLKANLVSNFENEISKLINIKRIVSPIEQIFLMEWKYYRVEERCGVKLLPQEPVKTQTGNYFIDFLISPSDPNKKRFKIAIELDGHDFHEKNKEQVEKDKKRERSLVVNSFTVLRFSGSEIFRDCKKCLNEIENYINSL